MLMFGLYVLVLVKVLEVNTDKYNIWYRIWGAGQSELIML